MRWMTTLTVTLTLSTLLMACGGSTFGDSDSARPTELWRLSAEPLVSIGVVEGDEVYQLYNALSSVRLPDGRLAVLNGGSEEVRFFDAEGRFLSDFGHAGAGPGEFRNPTRIQLLASDGLTVWDQALDRFSFHDADGAFSRVERLERNGEPFPADVWLYGRNLIDSPILPAARGHLVQGIEALPPVDSLLPVRYVRVTEQGRFWVSNARVPADTAVTWSVYELDGTPTATLTLPARFEPHDIGHDYVLGRWFDDMDVNYIRMYALEKPAHAPSGRGLGAVRANPSPSTVEYAPADVDPEVRPMLVGLFKRMASFQEINYATNGSYSADLEELGIGVPDELRVDLLRVGPMGWLGLITHRPTGTYCILSYGGYTPMGWSPGAIVCPGLDAKVSGKGGFKGKS